MIVGFYYMDSVCNLNNKNKVLPNTDWYTRVRPVVELHIQQILHACNFCEKEQYPKFSFKS